MATGRSKRITEGRDLARGAGKGGASVRKSPRRRLPENMTTPTECAADLLSTTNCDFESAPDAIFERVASDFAAPLARLVRAHEADPALQQDLMQEVHLALWRSLRNFDRRCSLRTWVYRVAHHVAATHILRSRRRRARHFTTLDDAEFPPASTDIAAEVDAAQVLQRLYALIQCLAPLDREIIILHLEGLSADEIAEIAGLTSTNTHTKLHRIRQLLATKINAGDRA
jgi:RNA polymerase sigma-70 factor, ECF subfamily